MGDAFRSLAVPAVERGQYLRCCVRLLCSKLREQIPIETSVSCYPVEPFLNVDARCFRDYYFVFRLVAGLKHTCGRFRFWSYPPKQRLEQLIWIDRLRNVIIHSGIETTLALFNKSMSGHCQNR